MEDLTITIGEPTPEETAAREAVEQRKVDAMTKLRSERDALIPSTDKYIMADYPIRDELRKKWGRYRQHLRDLPGMSSPDLDEDGKLTDVEWPVAPVVEALTWKNLREERNMRLAEVDWVFSTDYQIPDDKRVVWIAYRRALRELPSTTEDPTNPVWPEKPMMPTGETSASTVETDLQSEKSKVVLLQNVVFNLSKRIQALESA
jgi:hypothetical protein